MAKMIGREKHNESGAANGPGTDAWQDRRRVDCRRGAAQETGRPTGGNMHAEGSGASRSQGQGERNPADMGIGKKNSAACTCAAV